MTLARWREGLAEARAAGVPAERIILDPGLGFGLPAEGSLALLRRLPELRQAGHAILVGPSRKGFVGVALGGLPVAQRLEGTLATVALAVAFGADAVRVHDVLPAHRGRLVADAVCRPPAGEAGGGRGDRP
jgi:dihydropteroate synthase